MMKVVLVVFLMLAAIEGGMTRVVPTKYNGVDAVDSLTHHVEIRSPQRRGGRHHRPGGHRPHRPPPAGGGGGSLFTNPLVIGGTAVAGGLAGAGLYQLITGK